MSTHRCDKHNVSWIAGANDPIGCGYCLWEQDAREQGYAPCLADVVAWLDEKNDGCWYAGQSYSEAIERGEAKGASNE